MARRWRACLPAIALGAALAGCASFNSVIDSLPREVGLPADTPERPAAPFEYPAVHDMPPPRQNAVLSAEEQIQLEEELVAVRARHDAVIGAAPAAKRKAAPQAPPAPPRPIPAAGDATIY